MRTLILIAGLVWTHASSADPAIDRNLSILARCYNSMANTRISQTDPLYRDVKSGLVSGVDACMRVYDSAKLLPSTAGANEGKLQSDTALGRKVLNNRYHYYKSLQKNDQHNEFSTVQADQSYSNFAIPPEEPAFYMLRAAFDSTARFDSIVKYPYSMMAIRDGGPSQIEISSAGPACRDYVTLPASVRLEKGELIGVRPINSTTAPARASYMVWNRYGLDVDRLPDGAAPTCTGIAQIPMHPHNGASGILGSTGFFTMNNGQQKQPGYTYLYPQGEVDGIVRTYRRLGQTILDQMLCRNLPVIRATDPSYVSYDPDPRAFRSKAKCMQCHATMEPLAALYRNYVAENVEGNQPTVILPYKGPYWLGKTGFWTMNKIYPSPTTEHYAFPLTQPIANYANTHPDGALYYRSATTGDLITSPTLRGVEALGTYLSGQDDLYVCAAKRELHFLTGVDVPFYDPGDPDRLPLTSQQTDYRNLLIQLGVGASGLKTHQNLRTLVRQILESPAFVKNVESGT